VDLDVAGLRIEPKAGQGAQVARERVLMGTDEDEVEMRNPNVVPPDVDLFHAVPSSTMALELPRPSASVR
jgi:hypothetical protein